MPPTTKTSTRLVPLVLSGFVIVAVASNAGAGVDSVRTFQIKSMSMKPIPQSTLVLLCLLTLWPKTTTTGAEPPSAPTVPASLAAPADQTLALTLTARGVQIYECRPVVGEPTKFEWALVGPEADLFDSAGKKVGRHYAGPTWELTDGGKVVGRVKAKADAPDGRGVAWLLLDATTPPDASNNPGGVMGRVRSVQRLDTVGGAVPRDDAPDQAKAGQRRRVDYTAKYCFYVVKPQP